MSRIIFNSLLACFLLAASPISAQTEPPAPGEVYSLDDAVNYAMANATAIRNARIDILDAEQNIKENKSRGLPDITANIDYQHFLKVPVLPLPPAFAAGDPSIAILAEAVSEFATLPPGLGEPDPNAPTEIAFQLQNNFVAGLGLRTMLFDGSFFVGLRAARASKSYFALELETTEREVRSQVTRAYFPVLLLKTNINVLDNNISNLQKLLRETQAQFDAGFVEKLDVDRLRLSINNLTSQRDQLGDQAENALRALKFTINYPLDEPLAVEDDLESIELELEQAAITGDIPYGNRPELRLLDKTIELQDLNIELQQAAYLPTAYGSLSGQYQYQGDNLSDGFWAPTVVAGLSVSVPIYDFGGRSARVERAKLDKQKVVNQRNDVNRSIQLEVLNARATFLAANKRFEATKENLELANNIYDVTQIKYNEGVGSSIEVVQAEQQLYESQANYLQSLYDALVAREDLKLALGQ